MHADVVEVRQIAPIAEVGEGLIKKAGTSTCDGGKLLREACLRGVEVGAVPLGRGCSGMQVGAHALPEPEFAGGAKVWSGKAGAQESKLDPQRVEFLVVAKGVADIGHIAGGPVGHGSPFEF